ncbi:MAG: putative glutathione S-transferase [Pseudoalteromonas tetraodonis]|jgi:putative glutathione S-transferase
MGLLVDGKWHDQWYQNSKDGKFVRHESAFRSSIGADIHSEFPAESGRYHLYVSLACPWAHRTLIFRTLKGLEEHISVSVVHPNMLENGWSLASDFEGATGDSLYNHDFLYQLYQQAKPDYSGRVTVPVLWDKNRETIVSNESAEIIRMFNSEFNSLTGNTLDLYPEAHRAEIDELNDYIYDAVNNGVYRAGFATSQAAYQQAVVPLFDQLDAIEERLSAQGPYLLGEVQTEADWRLFTTLYRFDPVYVGHFKCNLRRIADYPALSRYLQRLIAVSGVQESCNLSHIKQHYYYSHSSINPTRIIPLGPL